MQQLGSFGYRQQHFSDHSPELFGERWGNGVADLPGDLGFRADELEVVWETHQASGLTVSDRPVLFRVQIAALFRFKEFCADRDGRPLPP